MVEWAEFGIQQVRVDDYVIAGSNWYTPDPADLKAFEIEI
jgi:hypothetical protein